MVMGVPAKAGIGPDGTQAHKKYQVVFSHFLKLHFSTIVE